MQGYPISKNCPTPYFIRNVSRRITFSDKCETYSRARPIDKKVFGEDLYINIII